MASANQIIMNAIGLQDKDITDPKNPVYYRNASDYCHSPFTKTYRSYDIYKSQASGWPFGQLVIINLKPKIMGDLWTNAFLRVDMPSIADLGGQWCDKLGRAIIEKVEFKVNDQLIETLDDYAYIGIDELFTTFEDRANENYSQNSETCYKDIVNINNLPVSQNSSGKIGAGVSLYIDLKLFFSRSYNTLKAYKISAFPLCAIYNQEIYLNITFRPQSWFCNYTGTLTVPKITLVNEEILLGQQERYFYMRNAFSQPYVTTRKQFETVVDNSFGSKGVVSATASTTCPQILRYELHSDMPLKAIFWMFQNRKFNVLQTPTVALTNPGDSGNQTNFWNRYNFSTYENLWSYYWSLPAQDVYTFYDKNVQHDKEIFGPIISETSILNNKNDITFLQSGDNTDQYGSLFFRTVQASGKNLFVPMKNIYCYVFDNDGRSTQPTGSENYSIMDGTTKHTLQLKLINDSDVLSNTYIMRMYNVGLKNLVFQDGFCTVTQFRG